MKKNSIHKGKGNAHAFPFIIAMIAMVTLCVSPAAMPYSPADGSISGTVMYYGNLAAGLKIYISYHTDINQPPVGSTNILSPGGAYTITSVPSGSYYISAFLDVDDSGGGPPDNGEPIGAYDSNGDGDPDQVTISSEGVTGIDINVNQLLNAGPPIILYVDDITTGGNDGSSWQDAYRTLGAALTAAVAGREIWVAAGTYKPGTLRTNTFQLKNNVRIFGGFAGTEILRSQRNLKANATILSGEINGSANTDNIYHVVTGSSTDRTAVLSDVTIMRGYANDGGDGASGWGGGMKIRQGSPTVVNVRFLDNFAISGGGGMENAKTTYPGTLVINCTFSGNSTTGLGGAGMLNWTWSSGGGEATVINSSFAGNTGSAILVNGPSSNATLYNVNVSGSLAIMTSGGMSIFQSILSGSCPAGAYCDANTLTSTDSQFVDANGADNTFGTMDDNLRLQSTSPAIDSGDNSYLPADAADIDGDGNKTELIPLDLDGASRFLDSAVPDTGSGTPPIVDRGAYEFGDPPGAFSKTSPADAATSQPLSLDLTWGSSSKTTRYEYCYDTTDDNACSTWVDNGTSNSASLSGLATGATYYWHVRAINGFGTTYSNGSDTAYWSFTTGTQPGAFNKSSPSNNATSQPLSLNLSWESSSGATHYEYCYDTTNDNACGSWVDNGTSTSAPLTGLAPGMTYYWHVRALNDFGSTYSNGVSTTFWSFTTSSSMSIYLPIVTK